MDKPKQKNNSFFKNVKDFFSKKNEYFIFILVVIIITISIIIICSGDLLQNYFTIQYILYSLLFLILLYPLIFIFRNNLKNNNHIYDTVDDNIYENIK